MKDLLTRFWRDEDGLETVEWAVVAAVVIGGSVAAFKLLGTNISTTITKLTTSVT
jgi:Flp pilus assembly pilin Flp